MGTAYSRIYNPLTVRQAWPVASSGAAGRAMPVNIVRLCSLALACLASLTSPASSQGSEGRVPVEYKDLKDSADVVFKSTADSLEWERDRSAALRGSGLRVVISLRERRVLVMRGADTVRSAKAAVASGMTINYAGKSWTFRTPRGRHTVRRKIQNPVWTPPDWLYAEVAMEHSLELGRLRADRPVRINSTERLVVRNGQVGLVHDSTRKFSPLPVDEHIVFNDTLYIPPFVTENRKVPGELGRYALDMGDGYMIHGTPDQKSIGRAVTHGCIRLGDWDIAWLFHNIPVGTPVHVF